MTDHATPYRGDGHPEPYWCQRRADLELVGAVIEKERLITAGALHSEIMAQCDVVDRMVTEAARTRGLVGGQLTLGTS